MLPTALAGLEASQAQTDTFIQFYKAHSVGLYRYALSWVKNPPIRQRTSPKPPGSNASSTPNGSSPLPEESGALDGHPGQARRPHPPPHRRARSPWTQRPTSPAPEVGDPGDIIAVLRSMPETYRTVLELRFLEELDSAEIARRTGLSVSAVDTRIHRGQAPPGGPAKGGGGRG